MKLFRKNKEVDPIDDRTPIEKTFEDKGQKIGKKAGEITQKGINKFNEIKDKLDSEGKLDSIREFSDKVQTKTKEFDDAVNAKTKEVVNKFKKNKEKDE